MPASDRFVLRTFLEPDRRSIPGRALPYIHIPMRTPIISRKKYIYSRAAAVVVDHRCIVLLQETAMEQPRKAMASTLVVIWLLLVQSCKQSLALLPFDATREICSCNFRSSYKLTVLDACARRPAGAVCSRSRRLLGPGPRPLPLLLQDGQVQGGVRRGPLRRRALQERVPLPAAPLRVPAPAVRSAVAVAVAVAAAGATSHAELGSIPPYSSSETRA